MEDKAIRAKHLKILIGKQSATGKEVTVSWGVPCGIGNETLGRERGRLTRRVAADVADVLLGDALLQQPHARAVLPA